MFDLNKLLDTASFAANNTSSLSRDEIKVLVGESMLAGRAVNVRRLGLFTHSLERLELGNRGQVLRRVPTFIAMEVNFQDVGSRAGVVRAAAQAAVTDAIDCTGKAVGSSQSVDINLGGMGHLLGQNRAVKVRFSQAFVEKIKELSVSDARELATMARSDGERPRASHSFRRRDSANSEDLDLDAPDVCDRCKSDAFNATRRRAMEKSRVFRMVQEKKELEEAQQSYQSFYEEEKKQKEDTRKRTSEIQEFNRALIEEKERSKSSARSTGQKQVLQGLVIRSIALGSGELEDVTPEARRAKSIEVRNEQQEQMRYKAEQARLAKEQEIKYAEQIAQGTQEEIASRKRDQEEQRRRSVEHRDSLLAQISAGRQYDAGLETEAAVTLPALAQENHEFIDQQKTRAADIGRQQREAFEQAVEQKKKQREDDLREGAKQREELSRTEKALARERALRESEKRKQLLTYYDDTLKKREQERKQKEDTCTCTSLQLGEPGNLLMCRKCHKPFPSCSSIKYHPVIRSDIHGDLGPRAPSTVSKGSRSESGTGAAPVKLM
eukprot:m51a1_g2908 hypothetical protein (552) ;mRNA; r:489813-492139